MVWSLIRYTRSRYLCSDSAEVRVSQNIVSVAGVCCHIKHNERYQPGTGAARGVMRTGESARLEIT